MFDGQYEMQVGFFIIAVLCIPVMLFGTPVYNMLTKKSHSKPHVSIDVTMIKYLLFLVYVIVINLGKW